MSKACKLIVYLLFVFWPSTVSAQGPTTNPNAHALLVYAMQKYPAWHIFSPRGEKVADAYSLPGLELHRSSECLDGMFFNEYPISVDEWNTSFTADLVAAVKAKGWFTGTAEGSVEIQTSSTLTINEEPRPVLKSTDIWSIRGAIDESRLDNPLCREFKSYIAGIDDFNFALQNRLLIGELYYAKGEVFSQQSLVVRGSIQAELQEEISRMLSLLGFNVSFEIEGGVKSLREMRSRILIDNPFAFNVMTTSESEYEFVISLLANQRLGGWLDESDYSTADIIALLRENRMIRDSVFCFGRADLAAVGESEIEMLREGEMPNCEEGGYLDEEKVIVVNRDDGADYIRGRALLRNIYLHLRELEITREHL